MNSEFVPSDLLQRVNDLRKEGFTVSLKMSDKGYYIFKITKKKAKTSKLEDGEFKEFRIILLREILYAIFNNRT